MPTTSKLPVSSSLNIRFLKYEQINSAKKTKNRTLFMFSTLLLNCILNVFLEICIIVTNILSFEYHSNDNLRYIVCCLFKIDFSYQSRSLCVHPVPYLLWTQLVTRSCVLMLFWNYDLKCTMVTSVVLRSNALFFLYPFKLYRKSF